MRTTRLEAKPIETEAFRRMGADLAPNANTQYHKGDFDGSRAPLSVFATAAPANRATCQVSHFALQPAHFVGVCSLRECHTWPQRRHFGVRSGKRRGRMGATSQEFCAI